MVALAVAEPIPELLGPAPVAGRARARRSPMAWLSLPGLVGVGAFFAVPMYTILCVAFGGSDPILSTPVPVWNPLRWNTLVVTDVAHRMVFGDLREPTVRTFAFLAIALAASLLVAYPVAFYCARVARRRGVLLVLMAAPFIVSYQMRMLAWVGMLSPSGLVDSVLRPFGLQSDWLGGRPLTVLLGLVYGYTPFGVLALYSFLGRMDESLLDAGRDLGASPRSMVTRVILPLSTAGIVGAALLMGLPMLGDYFTNDFLSGSPTTALIGGQVKFYVQQSSEPQVGPAIVVVLLGLCAVLGALGYGAVRIRRAVVR